ncbi:hypothetical protein GLUCOINTEAF2_0202650 [Komagataeibacter intermedius AF2]|uniref:Histidine kinase/HSP90-like ATPase domain-containing protein n=1 Tax=Komagataeibacter intermedius AF2 TaxID=1458464 RepID=A0A0N1FB46_9PROT|nr:ATP-binding protein [Komagataeibacter intermedius]KPH86599.1 hypothetical protein GLUCOINTEAF2_0202650 [Komagataeibacter intermedius AF2]
MNAHARSRWGRRLLLPIVSCLICVLLLWLYYPPGPYGAARLWWQPVDHAAFMEQAISPDPAAPPPEWIGPEGLPGSWRDTHLPQVAAPPLPDRRLNGAAAWYRFTLAPPPEPMGGGAAFYLARWKADGGLALYQNGQLVWWTPGAAAWRDSGSPLLVRLPRSGSSVIMVRMAMPPGARGTGMTAPAVGSYDGLYLRYQIRSLLYSGLPALLAVGLMAASIVLHTLASGRAVVAACRHMVTAAGLYGLYILCLTGGARTTSLPQAWIGWGMVGALFWLGIATWLLCCNVAAQYFPRRQRIAVAVGCVFSITTIPPLCPGNLPVALAPYVLAGCLLLLLSTLPALAAAAWRMPSRPGLPLLASLPLLLPGMLHDLVLSQGPTGLNHPGLMPYLTAIVLACGLHALCSHYHTAIRGLLQAARKLRSRLELQENALRESYDRLRQIEQRDLLSAERQRLMRDMHDGLGSTLTGAIHMMNGNTPHATIRQTLQDCLYDLKITVDSLESVDADLLALLANLRYRLTPRFQAHGMTLEWSVTAVPPLVWLTPSAALHILRILQEVIANIIKHAGANHIRITSGVNGADIVIAIEDNGRGFAPGGGGTGGRGLHNIRWRARAINSRVYWSARAGGTRFTLQMPREQPDGAITTLSPGLSVAAMKVGLDGLTP